MLKRMFGLITTDSRLVELFAVTKFSGHNEGDVDKSCDKSSEPPRLEAVRRDTLPVVLQKLTHVLSEMKMLRLPRNEIRARRMFLEEQHGGR